MRQFYVLAAPAFNQKGIKLEASKSWSKKLGF